MLDKQIKFYQKNKAQLFKEFAGKYIVIKDFAIIGAYNSHDEAYRETVKKHQVGTFLIKAMIARK